MELAANEPFTLAGRTFGVGTAIVRVPDHGPDLAERLGGIAAHHGGEVVATDTGYVDSGISLGSNQVRPLKPPRVLLAWDVPTDSYSAGWTRYVLERTFGQPASIVRVASFPLVDLNAFNVIVLPAGNYSRNAPADFPEQLTAWMEHGGILITLSDATRWATQDDVGLLASSIELRPVAEDAPKTEPNAELPERTPGALARVVLDEQHWLSSGTDGEIQMLITGQRIFSPLTLDIGVNAGLYAEAAQVRASGLIWEDVAAQLGGKAAVMFQRVGRGASSLSRKIRTTAPITPPRCFSSSTRCSSDPPTSPSPASSSSDYVAGQRFCPAFCFQTL